MLQKNFRRVVEKNQGALHSLEGNLLSAAGGHAPRSILVTSSRPKEGKTTCAISLACGLAGAGKGKVALVEGNLARPSLHRAFGLEAGPGLADYLSDGRGAAEFVQETDYANLSVMPCGADAAKLADLFDAEVFRAKLASLRKHFDYVVFDGASVLDSSEACLMAGHFDGVVLVVECERTKWEVLDVAKETVLQAGGKVLGVILNKRRYYVPKILYGSV